MFSFPRSKENLRMLFLNNSEDLFFSLAHLQKFRVHFLGPNIVVKKLLLE